MSIFKFKIEHNFFNLPETKQTKKKIVKLSNKNNKIFKDFSPTNYRFLSDLITPFLIIWNQLSQNITVMRRTMKD